MQYATMVDLLREAQRAGDRATAVVHAQVAAEFESWIDLRGLGRVTDEGEITEEEKDDLRIAFEQGCGLCVHDQE